MSFSCEFCNKTLSSKMGLYNHVKSAKYCLKLRNKESEYICSVCNKHMSEKRQHEKHEKKCKDKEKLVTYEINEKKFQDTILELTVKLKKYRKKFILLNQQNKQLQETIDKQYSQISELQNKLENIAMAGVNKTTNVTNNTFNKLEITKEWLDQQSLKLTDQHIENGGIGYANLSVENGLNERAICTDPTRMKLKYKHEDEIVHDIKGRKIAKLFFGSIKQQNEEKIEKIIEKTREKISNTTNITESQILWEKVLCLYNIRNNIDKIMRGEHNDLTNDFVKELCIILPKK
jgi:hypothetical protein